MAQITTMSYNVKTKEKDTVIREQTAEEIQQQAESQAQQAVEETRESNRLTLQDKARNALTANKDYLAIDAPSNAEAVAQIEALTKQVNALIRLIVSELDSTE